MPLLTCAAAAGVENGDLYEPGGMVRGSGLPKKFRLEKNCTDEGTRRMLWEESEKRAGRNGNCEVRGCTTKNN